MSVPVIEVHAATNPGRVRQNNEDCFLLDADEGFFAVFDGMGGHKAGEVASRMARDVVHDYVCTRRSARQPKELLERALQRASGIIFDEARKKRERRGMGTTAVVCLVEENRKATIAHVGDSRAYLLREGRLRLLTRDHTVVSELLARGAITAADAVNHPYKSVLSRNLGGKPTAQVDVTELELEAGDRLLLCSDGLNGFASHDAIAQVLTGAEEPRQASADLIDLAMRGGGGDNVTVLVVEAGQPQHPRNTVVVRTSGAPAWWLRRDRFLAHARELGVGDSPICSVLSADEAVEVVAGNLCEAIFHDLQQTTGIHVWTFTENLITGWMDQGGTYAEVRALFDLFKQAAEKVVQELADEEEPVALALEVAVLRSLVVAEMAIVGAVAVRVRSLESDIARDELERSVPPEFLEQKTMPRMGAVRVEPPSPAVVSCLDAALDSACETLDADAAEPNVAELAGYAHQIANDFTGDLDLLNAARQFFGERRLRDAEVAALYRELDEARSHHFAALWRHAAAEDVRAVAIRRLATAYVSFAKMIGVVVVDGCDPIGDALREATERTQALRAEVGRGEARIAELTRNLARHRTEVDPYTTIEMPPLDMDPHATMEIGSDDEEELD